MTRMVVDLPAPLGPRKPVTRPGLGGEGDVVDGGEAAVPLGEGIDGDHGPEPRREQGPATSGRVLDSPLTRPPRRLGGCPGAGACPDLVAERNTREGPSYHCSITPSSHHPDPARDACDGWLSRWVRARTSRQPVGQPVVEDGRGSLAGVAVPPASPGAGASRSRPRRPRRSGSVSSSTDPADDRRSRGPRSPRSRAAARRSARGSGRCRSRASSRSLISSGGPSPSHLIDLDPALDVEHPRGLLEPPRRISSRSVDGDHPVGRAVVTGTPDHRAVVVPHVRIEIWSDVVCPWCYIGKRRLETRAGPDFGHRDEVELVYRSFQLDPSAPRVPTRRSRSTSARSTAAARRPASRWSSRVEAVAAEEGLLFRLGEAQRANTVDAHRLLHLALAEGGRRCSPRSRRSCSRRTSCAPRTSPTTTCCVVRRRRSGLDAVRVDAGPRQRGVRRRGRGRHPRGARRSAPPGCRSS